MIHLTRKRLRFFADITFFVKSDIVSTSTHSELRHHSSAHLIDFLQVVRGSRTNLLEVHLLACQASKHDGYLVNQIILSDDVR